MAFKRGNIKTSVNLNGDRKPTKTHLSNVGNTGNHSENIDYYKMGSIPDLFYTPTIGTFDDYQDDPGALEGQVQGIRPSIYCYSPNYQLNDENYIDNFNEEVNTARLLGERMINYPKIITFPNESNSRVLETYITNGFYKSVLYDQEQIPYFPDVTTYNGPSVLIGDQRWMAENWSPNYYRNGYPIPGAMSVDRWYKLHLDGAQVGTSADSTGGGVAQGGTAGSVWSDQYRLESLPDMQNDEYGIFDYAGARCYYDEDNYDGISVVNLSVFGQMYNTWAIYCKYGIAPVGWHLPTQEEIVKLKTHLGATGATKLKGASFVNTSAIAPAGSNETGMNIKPGGERKWQTDVGYESGFDYGPDNPYTGGNQYREIEYHMAHQGQDMSDNGNGSPMFFSLNTDSEGIYPTHLDGGGSTTWRTPGRYIRCIKDPECIDYEGNSYKTVTIRGQHWTAENHRSIYFNDGSAIDYNTDLATMPFNSSDTNPKVGHGASGFLCKYITPGLHINTAVDTWKGDNPNNANRQMNAEEREKHAKRYGLLYNHYCLREPNFAPKGWRVPTLADYEELITALKACGHHQAYHGAVLADPFSFTSSVNLGQIPLDYQNTIKNNAHTGRMGFNLPAAGCRGEFESGFGNSISNLMYPLWGTAQYPQDFKYATYQGQFSFMWIGHQPDDDSSKGAFQTISFWGSHIDSVPEAGNYNIAYHARASMGMSVRFVKDV